MKTDDRGGRMLWLWTFILGLVIGAGAGYQIVRSLARPVRPTSVSATVIPNFDWQKVVSKVGNHKWTVLAESPGQQRLDEYKQWLYQHKPGAGPWSQQQLSPQSRIVFAQAVMPPAEQPLFFEKFQDGVREVLEAEGMRIGYKGSGFGNQPRGGKGPEEASLLWATIGYAHIPADGSPYPLQGVTQMALIGEGEVVTLVVMFAEVHHTD